MHHFTTGAAGKNKSYPLKTILEAVSMFNLAGYVHILDYKPEARKEKHAHVQLTIYALALARSTGLKLKDFKCAWFDEKDYFEFFPLTAVYWPYAADGLDECRKKDVFHR